MRIGDLLFDYVTDDECELSIDVTMDGGDTYLGAARINDDEAHKIVDHLTKVFRLRGKETE